MTRTRTLAFASVLLLLGLVELLIGLARAELLGFAGDLAALLVGWGTLLELPATAVWALQRSDQIENLKMYGAPDALQLGQAHLGLGLVLWLAGWGVMAVTLQDAKARPIEFGTAARQVFDSIRTLFSTLTFGLYRFKPPAPPVTLLHPRLARFVDFHWVHVRELRAGARRRARGGARDSAAGCVAPRHAGGARPLSAAARAALVSERVHRELRPGPAVN